MQVTPLSKDLDGIDELAQSMIASIEELGHEITDEIYVAVTALAERIVSQKDDDQDDEFNDDVELFGDMDDFAQD